MDIEAALSRHWRPHAGPGHLDDEVDHVVAIAGERRDLYWWPPEIRTSSIV